MHEQCSGSAVSPEMVSAVVPAQILQEDEIVFVLTKPSCCGLLCLRVCGFCC